MEQQKQNPLLRLKEFILPLKGKFLQSALLAVLGVAAGMVPYFMVSRMVIALLGGNSDMNFYVVCCLWAAGGYIGKAVLANWSTSMSHKATFQTLREIRKKLIAKLGRVPMGYLLDNPSGKFKDTIVDRVESMETTFAHIVPEMTANLLVPVLLIIYLFTIDWRMALVSVITLPAGMMFVMAMGKSYSAKYKGAVEATKNMSNAVVEYINGIEVIKTFNQNAGSYEKYANAVNYNADYYFQWMKSCQWFMSAYTAICPATLLTVLPAGYLFYAGGSLSADAFVTVMILSLGIVGPILAASNYVDSIAMMGTIVGEVTGILDAPELIRPQEPVQLKDTHISIKQVAFSYHAEGGEVLHGIDLEFAPNTVTALVGPSGGGKSTIAKLAAGYWDVSGGDITLGGKSLKRIPQKQLAGQIAYVSQDNYLFDESIRENIRMGRKGATDEEVQAAAAAAGCDEFIRGLDQGYDTRVGTGGGQLSGGERQRITIARAMLKDAPIVILDEATAYIDPENEAILQQAVAELVKGKTLIVIAHRLSTITDADQIIVVEKGNIKAAGTHQELLAHSALYQKMWQAHIGTREVEA